MPELPELQALAEGLGAAHSPGGAWRPCASGSRRRSRRPTRRSRRWWAGRVDDVWRRGKLIGVSAEGDLTLRDPPDAGRPARPGRARRRRPPGPHRLRSALALEGGEELRLRELSTEHRASGAPARRRRASPRTAPLAAPGPRAARARRRGLARGPGRPAGPAAHRAARGPPGGGHRPGLRHRDHVGRRASRPSPARTGWTTRSGSGWPRAADTVLGQALERARERIDHRPAGPRAPGDRRPPPRRASRACAAARAWSASRSPATSWSTVPAARPADAATPTGAPAASYAEETDESHRLPRYLATCAWRRSPTRSSPSRPTPSCG